MENLKRSLSLNNFQLKMIAILSMTIDHVGDIFFPEVTYLREVGRLAFPIFAFLIVEGFFHSRDIYKYMIRLGVFAVISEIPFDLALYGKIWAPEKQNVFISLFIGVAILCILQRQDEWILQILEVMIAMWFAEILHVDYGFRGIFLICWFYYSRAWKWLMLAGGAFWNFLSKNVNQRYGAFAMIPIALYNGKRGPNIKYLFYGFYPVHLIVLYLIHLCIA